MSIKISFKQHFFYLLLIVLLIGVIVWDTLHSRGTLNGVERDLEWAIERIGIANNAIKFYEEQSRLDKETRRLLREENQKLTDTTVELGEELESLYRDIRNISERERREIEASIRTAESIRNKAIECIERYKKIEEMAEY